MSAEVSQVFKTTDIPKLRRNRASILSDIELEIGQHVLFTPDVGEGGKLVAAVRAAVMRFNQSHEDMKYLVRQLSDDRVGVYAVSPDDENLPKPRAPRVAGGAKKKKDKKA